MAPAQLQRVERRDASRPARLRSPRRALSVETTSAAGLEQIAVDVRRFRQAGLRLLVVRFDLEHMLEPGAPLISVAIGQRQPGHPVQRLGILGVDRQQALVEPARLVEAVLAAGDPRQSEHGRSRSRVARQDLLIDLSRLFRALRFEGEAKLERRIWLLWRHLMGFAQVRDRLLAVAGIARDDAQEHGDAIVCRAAGLACREQALDLGRRARLLAEHPLRLLDLATMLGLGDRRQGRKQAGTSKRVARFLNGLPPSNREKEKRRT